MISLRGAELRGLFRLPDWHFYAIIQAETKEE